MSHSDIQKINSTEVMSAVTIFNQVVYLSGQVPKTTAQDIELQTQDILATIDSLLAQANSDKSRLLSAQIYIKNLEDFKTMNTVWVDWLKGCVAPSRATIQANLVNPDWLVEIAVTAAQKEFLTFIFLILSHNQIRNSATVLIKAEIYQEAGLSTVEAFTQFRMPDLYSAIRMLKYENESIG